MNSVMIIFLALLMVSCTGGDRHSDQLTPIKSVKTPVDSLFEEVMQGHDAGMAKLGRLKKNSQLLSRQIDSLGKAGIKDKLSMAGMKRVKDSLEAAHAAMFEWMDGFKADTLVDAPAQRIEYLRGQKLSVDMVRDRIMNSLRLYDSVNKK